MAKALHSHKELKVDLVDPSRFRSINNARFLKGLFFETSTNPETVLYTLKDRDHNGFPSLYRLYIEADDDTEYTFAVANLDGWEHWEMLCNCSWFIPFVSRWRKELFLKRTSTLLKNIAAEASDSKSKNHFAANKLLLDREWEGKVPKNSKRGRPTREEVEGKLKEEANDIKRQRDDLARISEIGQRRAEENP